MQTWQKMFNTLLTEPTVFPTCIPKLAREEIENDHSFPVENWVGVNVVISGKIAVIMDEDSNPPKRGILRNKSEEKHQ